MNKLRQRNTSGDREHAIELLKNTNLKYKEISKITGVPQGTLNALALTHRPVEVREANRRRAGVENLTLARETREGKSGDEVEKEEIVEPVRSSSGLSRTMIFSYEAKTDLPISKVDALSELLHLQKIIGSATGETFTFSINVEAKEGA